MKRGSWPSKAEGFLGYESASVVPLQASTSEKPKSSTSFCFQVVGNDLMKGVVFALSGFKNPYRSSLRSMGISMGARYRPDWDESCTHLM